MLRDGKLRKIPRKELRASLVNELNWFKTKEKGGENDVKKKIIKNHSIKKDTTTDFFLNFINRQKSENKKSEKQSSIKPNEELLNVKNKSFEFIYKAVNSLNLFLDRMLQSNLSMKILSFIIAIVLLFTINGNINRYLLYT